MKIEDFYTIYLKGSYHIYIDVINCTEEIRAIHTCNQAKSTFIKSYKYLKSKKFTIKRNKIGTFLINLLNNSDLLIELLEKNKKYISNYKPFYIEELNRTEPLRRAFDDHTEFIFKTHIYQRTVPNLHITHTMFKSISDPITKHLKQELPDNNNDDDIRKKLKDLMKYSEINKIISQLKNLYNSIDKIFVVKSKKTGYVSYSNPLLNIPKADILYMNKKTHLTPYLYKYEINSLQDLFNVSVYSLSLAKYKIYKCKICNKYFINNRLTQTCSTKCSHILEDLKIEKIRDRARDKNCEEVNHLLKSIRGVLNRYVKNKNEQTIRNNMLESFEGRYKNKLKTLKDRYKHNGNGYNKELTKWLDNEYEKVKKTFPSKKYGNKNRLIK
ncbi:MAG: hypothetical protein J6I85_01260 [Clostridia bacterium]|nr:hypothetical protein [Clostridia bacterium]